MRKSETLKLEMNALSAVAKKILHASLSLFPSAVQYGPMDGLHRFKEAQDEVDFGFECALAEIRGGEKTSHWIWYIFPQIAGLGRSSTAQEYALRDVAEACDFLRDATLRERLITITTAAAAQLQKGVPLEQLMGGETDSSKLVSCMTLFQIVAGKADIAGENPEFANLKRFCGEVLLAAETQGFPRCQHTINKCADQTSRKNP